MNLNKDVFTQIERLMIENEQKLMQMNSFEDKNTPVLVSEVYDKTNAMKRLPSNDTYVAELNKFVSDMANSIKLFSTHFTNFAHCPEGSINETTLKEKADYNLQQTKRMYHEYTKSLPSFMKPIAEQLYYDMFAVAIKTHPTISMVSTDGSNIALCGNIKKSVTKLVDEVNAKQQEARQQNAMSWFVDEMYDYLINGNISANAKSFISSYISQKTLINASQYLPESQLTDSEFQSEATEIKYHIRDKQYTFKDEVVFSNFMTTRSSYFDSVMQGVDYTNILSSPNVGTTDFHYEDGERILSENPRISYNHTEDYKTYLSMQAYSANRNVILSSKYEYERGFIRDGNNKYKI